MPADVVIRTERLSRTFSHRGSQQHVLRNLDLEVERGSFTVIMGPSGAGKSTLLYALSGLDRPSLGRVEVDGVDISGLDEDALARFRRDHCGFVFQQVHCALTDAEHNVALAIPVQIPGITDAGQIVDGRIEVHLLHIAGLHAELPAIQAIEPAQGQAAREEVGMLQEEVDRMIRAHAAPVGHDAQFRLPTTLTNEGHHLCLLFSSITPW